MDHKSNPFQVEIQRSILAKKSKLKTLRRMYSTRLPEIKNLNTDSFWSSHFSEPFDPKKGYMAKDREYLICRLIKRNPGRLLDVGFGRGGLEVLLAGNKNIDIYGIDISSVAVERARKFLRGRFRRGNVLNIPFRNGFFDIVVALELMEHIPPSITFKVLKELKRVLKKDGLLVISVPLNENLKEMIKKGENPSGHVRVYTPGLISAELKIAGFKIKEKVFLYAFRSMYYFKKLLQRTILRKRWEPNNIIIIAGK